jgi:hypothetical protein
MPDQYIGKCTYGDKTEKVYSYKFDIRSADGLEETSGW